MKEVSSAETALEDLPDGRVEARIEHELIRGVTPEMLVWWFRTFPYASLSWEGKLVSMYRIWHPRDHVRLRVMRRPLDRSPGVSRGAKIAIYERIGPDVTRTVARVRQMDESGIVLVVRRFGVNVAELRHTFTEARDGTLYRSRLIVGSTVPLVGGIVNSLARKRLFTNEIAQAWIKHNVEEVGNFQFFLPKLYAEAQRM
jgi:hypothetical protein